MQRHRRTLLQTVRTCSTRFRITDPLATAIVSPGAATTRLMKIWSLSAGVDCGQTSVVVYATPHTGVPPVAPAGAWKATMSPMCGACDA